MNAGWIVPVEICQPLAGQGRTSGSKAELRRATSRSWEREYLIRSRNKVVQGSLLIRRNPFVLPGSSPCILSRHCWSFFVPRGPAAAKRSNLRSGSADLPSPASTSRRPSMGPTVARSSGPASRRGCRRALLVGRLGDLHPIASCMFGYVHRRIRGANQPDHVGTMIGIHGNPDREGDRTQDRALVQDVEPVRAPPDVLPPH